VENQWDLLAPLGIHAPTRGEPRVEMPLDPDAIRSVAKRLAAAGVAPDAPLVVIHVSAGNPFRRWPADHFARVASALARADRRRRIIITSGPSEQRASDAVAASAQVLAGDAAVGILRCGEFDLSELRALVERAALYIGGDSGPLHIAATSRVPIVALFGPTLPERSMPWRDARAGAIAVDAGPLECRPCHQRHCVPGDFRCLTQLDPARVLDAAETLLRAEVSPS
jgi:ADP-heptose:LPS heptosyltransferase